jgi:hypothetical protein
MFGDEVKYTENGEEVRGKVTNINGYITVTGPYAVNHSQNIFPHRLALITRSADNIIMYPRSTRRVYEFDKVEWGQGGWPHSGTLIRYRVNGELGSLAVLEDGGEIVYMSIADVTLTARGSYDEETRQYDLPPRFPREFPIDIGLTDDDLQLLRRLDIRFYSSVHWYAIVQKSAKVGETLQRAYDAWNGLWASVNIELSENTPVDFNNKTHVKRYIEIIKDESKSFEEASESYEAWEQNLPERPENPDPDTDYKPLFDLTRIPPDMRLEAIDYILGTSTVSEFERQALEIERDEIRQQAETTNAMLSNRNRAQSPLPHARDNPTTPPPLLSFGTPDMPPPLRRHVSRFDHHGNVYSYEDDDGNRTLEFGGSARRQLDFGDQPVQPPSTDLMTERAERASASTNGEAICAICQSDFYNTAMGNRIPIRLPCGHVFHLSCVETYLGANAELPCPFCRQMFGRNDLIEAPKACKQANGNFQFTSRTILKF